MPTKAWYRYTDESGNHWRIQTTAALAEIGALEPTDDSTYPPLPPRIKPRYIWVKETPRPHNRVPARQKVILNRDRLKQIWNPGITFHLSGKEMVPQSYYGETVHAE